MLSMDSKQPPRPDKITSSSPNPPSSSSPSPPSNSSTSHTLISTTAPPLPSEVSSKPISKPVKSRFGLRQMMSQGLVGTIGSPIFVILGIALSEARSGLLISFILNGFLMLGFVLVFSELALSFPVAGGGYSLSKEAIGGAQGFLIGWLIWIGNLLFIAISG
ncbi:MAG: hypothetical protein E4G98_06715 [Promethearchaeota archaeon]|nr:MAG: hypothetical protein E4G98_06715 [Candidatus Lokiarchaeota archaeon]